MEQLPFVLPAPALVPGGSSSLRSWREMAPEVTQMRVLALTLMPAVLLMGQSSQYRFDATHAGRLAGQGRVPQDRAWRVDTGGKVRGTPVVTETMAVVGNERGDLLAVDPKDGALRWRRELGTGLSSPTLGRDAILVMGRDNVLRCVALEDGGHRWKTPLGENLPPRGWDYWVCSPTLALGKAFVGSGDGAVYAVDPGTGKVLWRTPTGAMVRSAPAVAGDTVYVGSFDGKVYALDASTGATRWTYDTRGAVQASPAVVDGRVIVATRAEAVLSLDARTGALQWRSPIPNGSWVITPVAVGEGMVVVGTSDEQSISALDLTTGKQRWHLNTRYRVFGAPVIQGGIVHCGTEGSHMLSVDLATGLSVGAGYAEGPVHGGPVPAGNRILVGSDDHHLYAFDTAPVEEPGASGAILPSEALGRYRIGNTTVILAKTPLAWSVTFGTNFPARVYPLGGDRLRMEGAEGALVRGAAGEVTGIRLKLGSRELDLQRLP